MTDLIEALRVPAADTGTGAVSLGMPVSRVDGRAKVTGQARYAAEHPAQAGDRELAYGVIVNSTIAKGRIARMQLEEALAVPGVLDILTHENHPRTRSLGIFYKDMTSPGGSPFKPLHDAVVRYSGQPVALVVAASFEAARYAASLVRVDYDVEPHETNLMAHLDRAHKPSRLKAGYSPPPDEKGDAQAAFARAPVSIEAEYYSGVEHHNPMELFASTVLRDADGHYVIYDKTQSSQNSRWYVSHVFGLPKHKVTVRNPYVGGAFGSGLRPQYQLILAMMASIQLERSVRVVMTRQQMFTFGHRPETLQRVKLAAERDGTLRAIVHTALAETSRFEDYVEVVVNWSGQLYACDNIKLGYELVSLDQYSPIDMRAPGAAHGVHALEVAMDELAHALRMDPLALRLKNYAERNPMDDMPYSTKELAACYHQGRRALRLGRETAGAAQHARRARAGGLGHGHRNLGRDADVRARQRGVPRRRTARGEQRGHRHRHRHVHGHGHDRRGGHGAAARRRELPARRLDAAGGAHRRRLLARDHRGFGGSGACEKLQRKLFRMARALPHSPVAKARFEEVEFAEQHIRLKQSPDKGIALTVLMSANDKERVEEKYLLLPSVLKQRKYVRATHSAVFCEVKVDEALGTVRVTRVVSAIAAGRILSAKTARSQVTGAVVWGISQALHEETHSDHRLGRFMNHNMAEYHVAVNADIHDIDVIFVQEDDRVVSELGAKGVGEIGIVGVAAAVCNAIFHATGRRVRSTPMTPDKVMAP
jgi:xanthine dehydrogenase YagR molybdenum-binding subunit